MKLSISKKFCKRSIKCLAMFAPLAYLFGSLFFYFNGAHGNVVFAPDNEYLDPSSLVFSGDSSFNPTNDYFSLSQLRGYSVVSSGEIVSVSSSSVSFADTTLYLGGDVLRSAGDVYDVKSSDGFIQRNVGVVDLSTLSWTLIDGLSNTYFSSSINNKAVKISNLLSSKYAYAEVPVSSMPENAVRGDETQPVVYVKTSGSTPTGILFYELATPTTEHGSPFDSSAFWSASDVTFSFHSNINQPSVWLDYLSVVPKPTGDIEKIGSSFFGESNFLSDWGENAISDNPIGFVPFGTFLKFMDDNVFHFSESQIGLMAYGYFYYCAHILFAFLAFDIVAFIPLIVERISDKLGGKEDD